MLGLGLQINKMVNRAGGLPPLASLLTFFSKQRDDTTVINKLDSSGDSDAYLTVDPTIDIIDLSKYDIEDGTGDDLGWKIVKFNTINGEETYRVIYTAETVGGIKGLDDIPKSGADNSGKYILANDIDLDVAPYNTGVGWTPIGDSSNLFRGVFNGNGFEISNLFIDKPTVNYIGLFSQCSGAKVSNIGLVDCNVNGYNYVGGLVGYNMSSSTITNSYSTGNVTGNDRVGGLIGNCYNSSITNSYSTGDVTGYGERVGGLVGYNYGLSSSITNSYSTGIVNNDELPTQSYVSAFCGLNSGSTIESCFCIEHTNLDFSNTTVGVTNSGEKSALELKNILTYTTDPVNWDFTTIWNIDPTETINNGYPYLRNLEEGYVSPYGALTKIVTVNITETDPDEPHSYIKMPSDIKIGGLSLFNKDDPIIYDTTVSTTAEGYISEDPYLWHVDELNTETILSYLNDAYKFTWFVKNAFTEGTFEPLTIKEIFAYSQKIADADDLSKIMKYLGINVWYDSQDWIDALDWID